MLNTLKDLDFVEDRISHWRRHLETAKVQGPRETALDAAGTLRKLSRLKRSITRRLEQKRREEGLTS